MDSTDATLDATLPPLDPRDPDQTLSRPEHPGAATPSPPGPDALPSTLGRFTITQRRGAGGMGVIFEGHDPALGRDVALKLLRCGTGSAARLRLQREAQALAQLSHPHVVQVYEVGHDAGHSFIAMELVDGTTLDRWLERCPRSFTEILTVFVQAGRGLAAAHAQGLVHRDFKPSNVLVGADGRARVLDFGLVRVGEDPEGPTSRDVAAEEDQDSAVWDPALTQDGALMGTPAYMSPEQYDGDEATARSDQFSFCVALYEALWGVHPFCDSRHWAELAVRISRGEPQPAPRGCAVPRALEPLVLRGLARDPRARWPSMHALLRRLHAISSHPRRRRIRQLGLVGAAALAAAAVGASWPATPPSRCDTGPTQLNAVWGPPQRARVERALLGVDAVHGRRVWQQIESRLDQRAAEWLDAFERACALPPDAPALDRRMRCLERERRALHTRIKLLADADGTIMRHAVDALTGLPALSYCEDPEPSRHLNPLPADPRRASEVEALYVELDMVEAIEKAGAYTRALELATRAAHRAAALDFPPARQNADYIEGRLLLRNEDLTAAVERLEPLYFEATQDDRPELAANIASTLVMALTRRREYDRAERWTHHLRTELERTDGDGMPGYHSLLGVLEARRGNLDAAARHHRRTLELLTDRADEVRRELYGASLSNLGMVRRMQGRYEDALELYRRARDEHESQRGLYHPEQAITLNNMSTVLYHLHRFPEAEQAAAQAVEINRAMVGPVASPTVAATSNLAMVISRQGRHDEAIQLLRDTHRLLDETPRLLPARVIVERNLGRIFLDGERLAEAEDMLRRALSLGVELYGPQSLELVSTLHYLAGCRRRQGAVDEGLRLHQRAVDITESEAAADSPQRGTSLLQLAEAQLRAGLAGQALRTASRAERLPATTSQRARISFVMARAYEHLGDRVRARASARAALAALGDADAVLRQQIERWRDDRGDDAE